MENGVQPADGGHRVSAAPPNFRDRVVQKIMRNLLQAFQGRQVDDVRGMASRYEDSVFRQSNNLQDYFRTISMKMMRLQQNRQLVPQPLQQQSRMVGHQTRPPNAVLANPSPPAMPRTASTLPRPHQVQNMHINVNQAEPSFATRVAPPQWQHAPQNTTSATPLSPVVQLHPRHPTVVTQVQTQCPAIQQPRAQLMRMNQQQELRQSYRHTHGGQQSNVAAMQVGHHKAGQKGKQFGHPQVQKKQQPAEQADWREDMFQKITSLKDAHLSELMEFERALRARIPRSKTDEEIKSLPKEQADQYKRAVNIMAKISSVVGFLQLERGSIPELAKDQFDKCQASVHSLVHFYRGSKAGDASKSTGLPSLNCHELPPGVVDVTGATDDRQEKHEEQPAAESLPQSSQDLLDGSPLPQQQNHSGHLTGEEENGEVHRVAGAPVAINSITGDTAPFAGGTCQHQEIQEHPTTEEEAIPQLTQNVDPAAGTSPAQQQTSSVAAVDSPRVEAEDYSVKAEAETAVAAAKTPLSMAALRSLASDMGVNLKRAFPHTTSSGTVDDSSCVVFHDEPSGRSCYKRRKTQYGSLEDEIRATSRMLVETDISMISEDDTGCRVIKVCYNAVSIAPDLRAAIGASEISTKLLVPADYPRSSPVIRGDGGGPRTGFRGVVDAAFRRALVLLPEPRSIEGMARAWDSVARRAVLQFAHRLGGGTFSSRYGHWESCIPV